MIKKIIVSATSALATLLFFSLPALAAELFDLERMEIAAEVVEREPVGSADTFGAGQERVYAFIEARNIRADTTVNFVWFRNDREVAAVPLSMKQGNRWRTYSSITVDQRSGDWRVELRDEAGEVVEQATFRVNR